MQPTSPSIANACLVKRFRAGEIRAPMRAAATEPLADFARVLDVPRSSKGTYDVEFQSAGAPILESATGLGLGRHPLKSPSSGSG